jgi:antitoxin HigA-1
MPVAKHLRTQEPPHPGAVLRDEVLPALRIGPTAAANALGISRQTLHAILAERAAVTPEMAVRLGKLFGGGPGRWLRLQVERDLWRAEHVLAAEVAVIPTLRHTRR